MMIRLIKYHSQLSESNQFTSIVYNISLFFYVNLTIRQPNIGGFVIAMALAYVRFLYLCYNDKF